MDLLVGLGNPGRSYTKTRHNAGFVVMDYLAQRFRLDFRAGKGEYDVAEWNRDGRRVWVLKPLTYMNNSGIAVREFTQFYKITARHVMVVCDDAALPVGRIRMRTGGSDGGQNGLKSIIYHLNTDEFPRLRIGVANDRMRERDLADFVLSPFDADEAKIMEDVVKTAGEALVDYLDRGIDYAMNRYNRLMLNENPNS
jgi:PTH1 family peptidyl-tRNA hydrolase